MIKCAKNENCTRKRPRDYVDAWQTHFLQPDMTLPTSMRPSSEDDQGLTDCNDILVHMTLGKMNSCAKDVSLHRTVLVQNALKHRLVEKAQGRAHCRRRQEEMELFLFRRTRMYKGAYRSTGSGIHQDQDREDDEDNDEYDVEEEREKERGDGPVPLPIRIKLVIKSKQLSQKRSREFGDGEEAELKRRCGEPLRTESPPPAAAMMC